MQETQLHPAWVYMDDKNLLNGAELLFKSFDIETLANKMNNQPNTQSLEQEIEELRAEVERLGVENTELKTHVEINPRKEETLLYMILALAKGKHKHDFDASKTGTNAEIRRVLFDIYKKQVLRESTIRNRLADVELLLPTKPTKM